MANFSENYYSPICFFIFFMFALPHWWLAVFVALITISFHVWFVTRPGKMLEISSIDS